MRNFFGEVRFIEQRGFTDPLMKRRFLLLIPKLKYAKARAKNFGMNSLAEVLEEAVKLVEGQPECFKRFVEFFEAILAYHKAYGGN
jgi:CRISPR-associated protein Csm2